jgi:hypothetical protein
MSHRWRGYDVTEVKIADMCTGWRPAGTGF